MNIELEVVVQALVDRVKSGKMTLNQVPDKYRQAVQEKLSN